MFSTASKARGLRNALLTLWAVVRSQSCQRWDVLFLVPGRSRKENKYIRKEGNNFKNSFLVWSGFFSALRKQKKICKKFMV